jgi:RNA polymerase sigma-70 factor (ECF subfamily)
LRPIAELICASQDEPLAFAEVYERCAEPLLVYFYRRVFDPEVAADLLAETIAIAFERRSRFRDRGLPGEAWIYGIAAKQLSRWFRRRRVELKAARRLGIEVPVLDHESSRRIEALIETDSYRESLVSAIERMPAGERAAVGLRVLDELDYGTIAARLACSESAARTRVHRGLARLWSLLEVST